MKKTLALLTVLSLLTVSMLVTVRADDVGTDIDIDITTEDFEPIVNLCGSRVVLDDEVEPGRLANEEWLNECLEFSSFEECGEELKEREHNYAFEGESIAWEVIVFDKNGIEKIEDVFATVGNPQGAGNPIEVNCNLDQVISDQEQIDPTCNLRVDEEELTQVPDNTAAYYTCILTVETPFSMYGPHWVTVEALDLDGLSGTMAENENWFLNPIIALSIDGSLQFEDVRPGASAYSSTLLVGNDADASSGVMMDMFISGTNFFDSSPSGAKCPVTNELQLGDGDSSCDIGAEFGGPDAKTDPFCYFATNGAFSTLGDNRRDAEGYVGINHAQSFGNSPLYGDFYGNSNGDDGGYEMIQSHMSGPYFRGNKLSPGSEMALTFRLNLPEPCNGDFDTGSLFFWGEAI